MIVIGWFYLPEIPGVLKTRETETKIVATRDLNRGSGKLMFQGYRVSVLEDKKVIKWMIATLLNNVNVIH